MNQYLTVNRKKIKLILAVKCLRYSTENLVSLAALLRVVTQRFRHERLLTFEQHSFPIVFFEPMR